MNMAVLNRGMKIVKKWKVFGKQGYGSQEKRGDTQFLKIVRQENGAEGSRDGRKYHADGIQGSRGPGG